MTGEKPMLTPVFRKGKEDLGNSQPVSLTFIPGKVMEQLILKITKHLKVKKVIEHGQDGFTKRKSCLTNLTPSMMA